MTDKAAKNRTKLADTSRKPIPLRAVPANTEKIFLKCVRIYVFVNRHIHITVQCYTNQRSEIISNKNYSFVRHSWIISSEHLFDRQWCGCSTHMTRSIVKYNFLKTWNVSHGVNSALWNQFPNIGVICWKPWAGALTVSWLKIYNAISLIQAKWVFILFSTNELLASYETCNLPSNNVSFGKKA